MVIAVSQTIVAIGSSCASESGFGTAAVRGAASAGGVLWKRCAKRKREGEDDFGKMCVKHICSQVEAVAPLVAVQHDVSATHAWYERTPGVSNEDVELVELEFQKWDSNNSMIISSVQLTSVLKLIKVDFSDEEIEILMTAVDKSQNGVIKYKDLIQWLFQYPVAAYFAGMEPSKTIHNVRQKLATSVLRTANEGNLKIVLLAATRVKETRPGQCMTHRSCSSLPNRSKGLSSGNLEPMNLMLPSPSKASPTTFITAASTPEPISHIETLSPSKTSPPNHFAAGAAPESMTDGIITDALWNLASIGVTCERHAKRKREGADDVDEKCVKQVCCEGGSLWGELRVDQQNMEERKVTKVGGHEVKESQVTKVDVGSVKMPYKDIDRLTAIQTTDHEDIGSCSF